MFRLESDMAPMVKEWLSAKGLIVKGEVPTPWGICDFVALSFRKPRVRMRLEHGQRQPVGPPLRVALLQRIPDRDECRAISFKTLNREFGAVIGEERLRRELDDLRRNNFVLNPKKNHFQKINGWYPLHRKIVAVEMKLARIEEVIAQAEAHLGFADSSYIALPKERAERLFSSSRLSDLKSRKIGLLAVDQDLCTELLKSDGTTTDAVDSVTQAHCVEMFWRSEVTSSSS